MEASDEGLLNRAIGGDREALAQLLKQHAPLVRRQLEGKIPQRWQCVLSMDDVMQQTYLDAWLGIGRFVPQGIGSFTAWLVMLAEHNLGDAVRMLEAEKRGKNRCRIEPGVSDESFVALYELLGSTQSTPSRHAARDEARSWLQWALAQLPSDYRTVVEMVDLKGRPVEEVAAVLKRSIGAVCMLRIRAHRWLRELMGPGSQFFSDSA